MTSAIRRRKEAAHTGSGQKAQAEAGRSSEGCQELEAAGRTVPRASRGSAALPAPWGGHQASRQNVLLTHPACGIHCGERETNIPSMLLKTSGLQAPGFCLPPHSFPSQGPHSSWPLTSLPYTLLSRGPIYTRLLARPHCQSQPSLQMRASQSPMTAPHPSGLHKTRSAQAFTPHTCSSHTLLCPSGLVALQGLLRTSTFSL